MRMLKDLVEDLTKLSPVDMELVGDSLAAFSPATAERLKNAITVAQQEWDALEDQERQYEMMSKEADMEGI